MKGKLLTTGAVVASQAQSEPPVTGSIPCRGSVRGVQGNESFPFLDSPLRLPRYGLHRLAHSVDLARCALLPRDEERICLTLLAVTILHPPARGLASQLRQLSSFARPLSSLFSHPERS
jgi:hypothetical protein